MFNKDIRCNVRADVRNISTLFDRFFLQDGHIGSCSSLLALVSSPSSGTSDGPDDEYNVNFTGIRFFKLEKCVRDE